MIAQHAAQQDVRVRFVEYDFMSYVFPHVMRILPQTAHYLEVWAGACQTMVECPEAVVSGPMHVAAGAAPLEATEGDVRRLAGVDVGSLRKRMYLARLEVKGLVWTGPSVRRREAKM